MRFYSFHIALLHCTLDEQHTNNNNNKQTAILRRLMYLLNEIQKLYEVNKMTAENLG